MTRSPGPVTPEADFPDHTTVPPRETTLAFQAEAGDAGRRLDVVAAERLPQYSRSRLTRIAQQGGILVDGTSRKPAFRLRGGQTVEVRVPPAEAGGLRPEMIPLDVVYEDADLVVVNKPAGLTVHPAPGHPSGTLVNALLAHVPDLSGIGGTLRPGIVHRLDKDTSGLLVVAKSDTAHRALAAQLRAHTMVRTYLAIVRGGVRRDRGVISAPVGRHPVHRTRIAVTAAGRAAVTRYTVLERFPRATLVACHLETGRTHQIRVHMNHIGHPILGDPVYGHARVPEISRQALHAARLEFTHPRTGRRVVCTAPLPEDFQRLLHRLRDAAQAASGDGRRSGPSGGEN
jgi:23S rRNA pseudouridine1911/1915/1917 synthase